MKPRKRSGPRSRETAEFPGIVEADAGNPQTQQVSGRRQLNWMRQLRRGGRRAGNKA